MNEAARPSNAGRARPDDLAGRTLGDFELIRRLGEGGMGQVYLARQLSLKRQVAVKVLKAEVAANETSLRRFQQEAEAVARINHANIVQVYAIGEADGLHYMALEYVEGKNLRDYLSRKGPPDLPISLNIIRQVALALLRAGELGIVHRDIKPENILVTRKTEVKVADFGLSRFFTAEAQPLSLTQSGVAMGTPLYMAPEQVQGGTVDPRTDIYSFGVTCYHLLAGQPPFRGNNGFEVALQHVQAEPPPLHEARPDLPADLCAMVHRMMAKRPEDRYQTAREVLREVARVRESLGTSATLVTPAAPSGSGAVRQPGATSLTLPAVEPSTGGRRVRNRLLGASALLAAALLGAGLHALRTAHSSIASGTTDAVAPTTTADQFAEIELALQNRIDDTQRTWEAAADDVLDLTMLYIRRAQELRDAAAQDAVFRTALDLVGNVADRGPFRNITRSPKAPEYAKYQNLIVTELGKGIVLAYKDQPEASDKLFLDILEGKHEPVKARQAGVRVYDVFLNRHRRWKKELADAIDRNRINLHGKPLDPVLERYRSYAPRPIAAEKKG